MTLNASTTLNLNALGYRGPDPIPGGVAVPGLRTSMNRGHWMSWGLVEKVEGVRDWTIADRYVDENIRQGLTPIALLNGVPTWVDGGNLPSDKQWWNYCTDVATRYLGKIRHWEVANEYETDGAWLAHRVDDIGRLWRIASEALKAVDSGNFLICGSIQSLAHSGHGLQTLAASLRAFGQVPDAVGIHVYPQSADEVLLIAEWVHQVRGVLKSVGARDAQIWVTEWGVDKFCDLTPAQQTKLLRDVTRQLMLGRVDVSLHYMFDDHNWWGFKDRVKGKSIWNAAMATAAKYKV